ncbi:hypothetical protein B0T24DRAFT_705543, partial [Lasiosphaeria ovina]
LLYGHSQPLLRWLFEPRKEGPWIPLDPSYEAPSALNVIAAAARAPIPGVNPPWDSKTGIVRSQPSRRGRRHAARSTSTRSRMSQNTSLPRFRPDPHEGRPINPLWEGTGGGSQSQIPLEPNENGGSIDPRLLVLGPGLDQQPSMTVPIPPTASDNPTLSPSDPAHSPNIPEHSRPSGGTDVPQSEDQYVKDLVHEFLNLEED